MVELVPDEVDELKEDNPRNRVVRVILDALGRDGDVTKVAIDAAEEIKVIFAAMIAQATDTVTRK